MNSKFRAYYFGSFRKGLLAALSRLASAGREWIASLDINPVIWGPTGYTAVDALLVTKENNA